MSGVDGVYGLRDALRAIAANFSFTWTPGARSLFAGLDPDRFAALGRNPTALLAELSDDDLARVDLELLERVRAELDADSGRATWWQQRREDDRFLVAYFSTEFGLDESLPIYSGGLGVLAGDHLKSASELGVPLLGIGLLYRCGYLHQELDATGRQVERYPSNDPARLPLTAVEAGPSVDLVDDEGEIVPVSLRVWRADVGRVPLYLLDTDVEENPDWARAIGDRLYGGDRRHRLRQELVLGIGGVRALRELGLEPTVFHMNEGHSAFLQLERLRELVEEQGFSREAAVQRLRASTVFTTHTPVPAGNEIFDATLVAENVGELVARCGFAWEEFAALGRFGLEENGFGLTPFALRTSAHANGVSELHGEVSREMWSAVDGASIDAITNGVHARTWISDDLERLLGREEDTGALDFARAYELRDDELWSVHVAAKRRLFERIALDPDVLTIGFARRFATYKRAALVFTDIDRLAALPVQIVVSGKAHPADEPAKALMQQVVSSLRDPRLDGRVVFLEDYDMTIARDLVQGVDVWLNNPRRPHEASGTSGMKAAMNGVVNCSILDGWWAEAYSPEVGFAIGGDAAAASDELRDAADADALFAVLEQDVIPAFADRARWLDLMRSSIAQLGARFNTHRMVAEYVDRLYLPAYRESVGVRTPA